MVAQLAVDEADFWVQDDPDAETVVGDGSIRMILTVAEPEAVFQQALVAGATEVAPVAEGHVWRVGRLADPFGDTLLG